MVGVSVQDTGPEIAPEHLELVFDRFFRIDQGHRREHGRGGQRIHPPAIRVDGSGRPNMVRGLRE